MQSSSHFKHLLLINLSMLCISTSGALGRYIELPPPLTIWYRALFALLFLGLFCWWKKYSFRFDMKKEGWTIFLSGFFMAMHWVTYFYALRWGNVAIGMLSLFTFPVMTTLLEPIFFKTKLQKFHLFLGGMILLGIYFLAPSLEFNDGKTQGLLIGLFSALCYSLRNLIVKTKVDRFNGSMLMFYQMAITLVLLFPVLFIYSDGTITHELPYLIFLGLITTAIGHSLFLNGLKHFTVSTASIMSSVQPIFGILIAVIFLNEIPNWNSVIGGALILATVIMESVFGKR